MHHGIEHKDTNICEKFSEARRRKVVVDNERELRSPVNKFVTSYYVLGGTTNMEVTEPLRVLDLSKTPPSDEGENSMLPSGEHKANEESGRKENTDKSTSERVQSVQVFDKSWRRETYESDGPKPEGNGHVDSTEELLQRDGCRDKDRHITAEKHCDKFSNPAESDEDDIRTVNRLTRSQARMASLRRSEQEKERKSSGLPAKVPKIDQTVEKELQNEKSKGEEGGHQEEGSDSCMEDAANNNIEEASDRACPYCGMNCAKPSDMKRHLLVHMETKPFVCKVGRVGIVGEGRELTACVTQSMFHALVDPEHN